MPPDEFYSDNLRDVGQALVTQNLFDICKVINLSKKIQGCTN